jgi:hypothetical protein
MFDCNKVIYLLTRTGGAGVGLHFPGCSTNFNLELKFATVIEEHTTFHVWGTNTFSGRDFKMSLSKLVLDESHEAFFARYLLEIHGDHDAQTQLISSRYKLVALEQTVVKQGWQNELAKEPLDECGLKFGDAMTRLVDLFVRRLF